MIATTRSNDLPLVVIVTNDETKYAEVQQRLAAKYVFFICDNEVAALRVAREELVGGWLLDSNSNGATETGNFGLGWQVAARLADLSAGHRTALVDENYEAGRELAAYGHGAFYVCGSLPAEWLDSFLGADDVGCETIAEGATLVAP